MLHVLKSQLGTVRRFLERPISVAQGNVTLGVPDSSVREQAREERRLRLRVMRQDLFNLLEQHPTSRQVMRNLDLVERTLRRETMEAVETLPLRVLARALHELEKLVWDWSSPGLAEFRSRLAVAVKNRAAAPVVREGASTASPEDAIAKPSAATRREQADMDDGVGGADVTDLTEVDPSIFADMERSWAGHRPNAAAAPAA